jgi:hypothetical protein
VSRRLDWEKANRKEVVHEEGAEPVWRDFPEEAPAWVREEFLSKKDYARGGGSGRSARSEGTGAPARRYTCSRCQLTLGRNQFMSFEPPVCRDCS